jgi:hypothetical protein
VLSTERIAHFNYGRRLLWQEGLRLGRAGGLHETGKLFLERMASGQKEPTPLHVEIKLLPGGIDSLIGEPTALIGTQVAFADVVAKPLEHSALPKRRLT